MSDSKQLEIRPGGLETLSTGLNLAELDLHGGEGFWEEVRRYARESQLERQVDAAMTGRPVPRVWAFLESPGAGPAAAAAALGAAVLLADRGQSVVVVDADEQEPRITRWLGRTEREGWIDMVRFGASLHAASDELPSDGRRGSVIGVGSFAPTGVTPDEVAELLARLRRQADDLVLVLPAKLRSLPWLEVAHIRLLCWDLLSRSADETEKILAELDRMGAQPDALIGFGVEEFVAIHERLREEVVPQVAPPPQAESALEAPLPAVESAPPSPLDDVLPPVAEPAFAPGLAFAATEPASPETPAERPRRRTSGIFVFAALAAVACLVLLGLQFGGQLRGERGEDNPPAVARDDVAAETPSVADPAVRSTEPAGTDLDATTGSLADAPAGSGEAATTPGATGAPADVAGAESPQWAPFRKPAGQEGWSLWLYSLPNEAGAAVEVRALEARGIRAMARAIEIKDRGLWFRVYAGSFPDRAAAEAAAPWLKSELRHDWAVPARI